MFIYGSLRDPGIFKSVSGFNFTLKRPQIGNDNLLAEPALLARYRKVSPDNEGKRYGREAVYVNTAKGRVKAQAYLVRDEAMKKHFGDRFHVNLIHELWLRKRIEKFIKRRTRPGERTVDAELERLAERELLGVTERDLVITHYGADAVSDYYLKHELDRPRPSIKHLYNKPQAKKFIENYLALVMKQVLLNQLDEKILSRYRFELEHMRTSERYFKRSISLLIALQMINANSLGVDLIIKECFKTMSHEKYDLINYVKYAVRAARSMFDARVAASHLERIRSNFHPGLVPLGAEIELSNLGPAAVEPLRSIEKKTDTTYDGFRYFNDFCLDVLSWKLGGYIDDHSSSNEPKRRRGFLELAPGRLSLTGELSRPATADPWLLNQLIQAIVTFYDVSPHSLHLSFQLRKNQIGKQKVLPLGFVKCLLVLGGGLEQTDTGRLWVSRLGYNEIMQCHYGQEHEELVFARTTKRRWYMGEDEIADIAPVQATAYVQQYKFIRLEKRANYESLILCLKGLQLAYNPGDYLSIEQLRSNKKLRQQYEDLKKWAAKPTQISSATINRFITTVQDGLMNEWHRRPAHKLHYIDWTLSTIDVQLHMFNKQLKQLSTS